MSFEAIARTFRQRMVLRTHDRAVLGALRFVACDPVVDGDVPETIVHVEPYRQRYRILESGRAPREELTLKAVAESLERRIFERAAEDYPAAPMIRAASIRCRGRRLLLLGPKGGKTTLALRLMLAGGLVEGDEQVIARDGGVEARPHGLRVPSSMLPLFPALAAVVSTAPFIDTGPGGCVYNLEPGSAAVPWTIEHGRVDIVILLRPNRGGRSSIRPVGSLTLMRDALAATLMPPGSRGMALAAVVSALGPARGYDLSVGDDHEALRCIEAACAASS